MKLNLLLNSNDVLAGHRNIDPMPTFTSDQSFSAKKEAGDVFNLDGLAENGEVDEIVANDVIDFVDLQHKANTLANYVQKLAYGGKLIIGGIDGYEVAKSYSQYAINDDQFVALMYGDPYFPFGSRRGVLNLEWMINQLQQWGLKIINKRIHNFRYTVVAERPSNASQN